MLQSGEFERLGSSTTLRADVRVLAATNRDLEKAIKEGAFREDLFYRLNDQRAGQQRQQQPGRIGHTARSLV